MTAMIPWKPQEIAALTPLQLLCLARPDPPGITPVASLEALEAAERAAPRWAEDA